MASENADWNAPQVTPITEADGASGHPFAHMRNGLGQSIPD